MGNMGWFERLLRVVVGGLLLSSAAIGMPFEVSGLTLWASALAGLLLVFTGLSGHCWLYEYLDRMAEEKPAKRTRAKKSGRKKSSRRRK